MDLTEKQKQAFVYAYGEIKKHCPHVKTLLTTYFEGLQDNTSLTVNLPVCALHIDLVRAPQHWEEVVNSLPAKLSLSLGVIDGRNIWKNDYSKSLSLIKKTIDKLGEERVM